MTPHWRAPEEVPIPWRNTAPLDQRTQFIADHRRETQTITELCDRYGVSRKTAYKWIDRYLRLGPAGLEERSRRPHRAPNQTADEIVAAILQRSATSCVGTGSAPRVARAAASAIPAGPRRSWAPRMRFGDRKSTRLNSSHAITSRMPSSA